MNIPIISSWSGGKDCCLACYRAMQQGYDVKFLLNLASSETKRCCFHGVENKYIQMQADAMGIPLFQKEIADDMKEYEKEFKSAINELKQHNIEAMVFGDIYFDENKAWVERMCNDVGITAIEPLWNQNTEDILSEFIDLGFKAVVISAKSDLFDKDFVGRIIDREFLNELKEREICPCGEGGEFHTLVVDGPIFKKKIRIVESEPFYKEGFWNHWFLDIKKAEIL